MENLCSSIERVRIGNTLLPSMEGNGFAPEERQRDPYLLPVWIYFPHFSFAQEREKELYRWARGREWRLLQEGEVWETLRKSIPVVNEMVRKVMFPLRPYREPSPRVLVESLGLRYRESNVYLFHALSLSRCSKDRWLHNVLEVPFHGKMQKVVYYCALESQKSFECVQFLENNFERSLVQALSSIPEPDEELHWDKGECVYEEELAHARRSEEGFLWNALSLLTVKLQESWVSYAMARKEKRSFDCSSGAGLCLVLAIGHCLWCVNLGTYQAYLFQETRGHMWPLSRPCSKKHSQALGHMFLPSLSSRPNISFFPRESGVPLTLVIGNDSLWRGCPPKHLWEFLSCDLGMPSERERVPELVSCVTGYARMNVIDAPSVLIARIV